MLVKSQAEHLWSLTRALFLSPCRQLPHNLLLLLHSTSHPTQPHRLCLPHQQQMPPARGDVSIQPQLGWLQCDSRTVSHSSEGGWEGTGVCLGTCGCCLQCEPNAGFLPAAWSPRRGGRSVQTLRSPGCRNAWNSSRTKKTDPSLLCP